jgi:hypothetical protein
MSSAGAQSILAPRDANGAKPIAKRAEHQHAPAESTEMVATPRIEASEKRDPTALLGSPEDITAEEEDIIKQEAQIGMLLTAARYDARAHH